MNLITSTILERFLEQDKRKFEGLFPELIKRLILSSCSNISQIRMPGLDDIWAPGFDGIVENQEQTVYVAEGKSVWEFGTNDDSLSKINSDYNKRTTNPLGVEKSTTTFYLVTPKIWAYDNQGMSKTKWESEHNGDWRDVHIYDAIVLCDWINSEPTVCAWLYEQYGEGKQLSFSSIVGAWESFSNRTDPPLTFSMFIEGRQEEISSFQDKIRQKMCRVRSDTFLDAYGFCLSALMQDPETANNVVVVNTESAYFELSKIHSGKVFLFSCPFSGQVSDNNSTILCYSKESTSYPNMIELPALWKSQFTKALCEMGLSEIQASECYSFTHGNLLSLIRRIPGNEAASRPQWANDPGATLLYPIIFLRQFSTISDIEKHVIEQISGINYPDLERKYEAFLRMEDAPIKRIDSMYYLVNYEEALMTLHIDVSDSMSVKMHKTVISLLSECCELDEYQSQAQASIIKRLVYNYIYFAELGSDQSTINNRISEILAFAKHTGCKVPVFDILPDLAEAAPAATLHFIESELKQGIVYQAFCNDNSRSSNYQNVLWALDKLVMNEDTAIRACRALYDLCKIQREYNTSNSPKDSLLNALCLRFSHTALTIEEKKQFVLWLIDDNCLFGVPFATELISKNSVFLESRIGAKNKEFRSATGSELYSAYKDISSAILYNAVTESRADWIEKALNDYWYIPPEVFTSSLELLASANFSPKQKLPIIFKLRWHLYHFQRDSHDNQSQRIDQLTKWIDCLTTDDPISKEGWRFYKVYEAPFPELLSVSEEDYHEIEKLTQEIREQVFAHMRDAYGINAVKQLLGCMDDSTFWGLFLGKNLLQDEYSIAASTLISSKKTQSLAGLINSVDMHSATEIYSTLSREEQESLLPLLCREDIDKWLVSPEQERLYWQNKYMSNLDDRSFQFLMKYNPCGILPSFFHKGTDPDSFQRLIEVVHAIVDSNYCSNPGLLSCIIQEYDRLYYSEEWAELCLQLYDKSVLGDSYGYYPTCLQTYFFNHPDKIVERYNKDPRSFYRHFNTHYLLPNHAYNDFEAFITWSDYLFFAAKKERLLLSTLGAIMGKARLGCDGIFPHEHIRIALERYSDDDLIHEVASGWLSARGARWVQDGLDQKEKEMQYRGFARKMVLKYPQTAKLLSIIAGFYQGESKHDRLDSELFPR